MTSVNLHSLHHHQPLSMKSHLEGGDEGNDGPLPSFKELLGDAGGAQDSQHAVLNVERGRGRADGGAEYPILIDCDDAPTPGANGGGDGRGETNSRSSVGPNSGGSSSEGQGGEQSSLSTPSTSPTSGPGSEARTPTLREKTNHPTSSPPPPSPPPPPPLLSPLSPPPLTTPPPSLPLSPPPPPNIVLSSTFDTQAELNNGALKDIEPGPSSGGKEKADIDDEHNGDRHDRGGDGREGDRTAKGATGVIDIQDSFKRTADNAGLNEGGEGIPRPEKVRRTDPIDDTDDADHDQILAQIRSQPKPVFRMPPSWRDFQQGENTTSSSRSNGAGDSQDDPLVVDDGEKIGESGASIRATSVEPEIGTAHLLSSHPREESKTLGCSDAPTAPNPPVEPLDRPTFPDVAPPQHLDGRVVGEDEHGAAAVASPPGASTPPLHQQSEALTSALEEEEWEIRRIIGKRRAGKGYEYRVRWKDTWLPRSELGNAKRLLQEFEARRRAQRGCRQGGRARPDKGR